MKLPHNSWNDVCNTTVSIAVQVTGHCNFVIFHSSLVQQQSTVHALLLHKWLECLPLLLERFRAAWWQLCTIWLVSVCSLYPSCQAETSGMPWGVNGQSFGQKHTLFVGGEVSPTTRHITSNT
jgi:hypothetical protein